VDGNMFFFFLNVVVGVCW